MYNYNEELNLQDIKDILETTEEYMSLSRDTFEELDFEEQDIDFFEKTLRVRLFQYGHQEFDPDEYLNVIEETVANKEIRELRFVLDQFKNKDYELPFC